MALTTELVELLKKNGLKVVQKSEYHFQIKGGHYVVNYYPTKKSAYINGMSQGKGNISDQDLVDFALGRALPDGVKVFGRRKMGSTKKRMYKKNKMCALCGNFMEYSRASVDHKIPISRGGSNRADNLQLAHINCNAAKGSSLVTNIRESHGPDNSKT